MAPSSTCTTTASGQVNEFQVKPVRAACFTQNSLESDSHHSRTPVLFDTSYTALGSRTHATFALQWCWTVCQKLPYSCKFLKTVLQNRAKSMVQQNYNTYHHTDLRILEHSWLTSVSHFNRHSKNTRNASKYVFSLLNYINTYCCINVLCTL